jgi:hypothetical protein
MAYEIEGRLLEVCTCEVICPCWVGRDPDGGRCDSALARGSTVAAPMASTCPT